MNSAFQRLQVAIGVRDLSASLAFYAALGFEIRTQMGDPPALALLGRDAVSLALVQTPTPAVAEFACSYIYVDDVDAAHAECVEARVPIVIALTEHPWGNRDFVVRDPDGHRIAIGWAPPG